MSTYTMNQWETFVSELDSSLDDLESSLGPAVDADHDDMFWRGETAYLWMNLPEVTSGLQVGTKKVYKIIGYGTFTNHMRDQVNEAFRQMKAVWTSTFNDYKRVPKTLHTRSETWADLVPRLTSADQELRSSTTTQNWVGAGAEAYASTLSKQLNAIADMATMANNAANNLAWVANIMASQYAWIMASFEQITNATDDVSWGTYVRSTSLVHWLTGFGLIMQELASGVGESWNAEMYTPVEGMGTHLEQNQELKERNTWPVAANLDGDFTPTAPVGGGYTPPSYPTTPTVPGQQPPSTVTVPGGYGGGPLDLDTADGHRDTAGINTQQY